ncbi:hypothetical protein CAI21_11845 [Alkalilimnicola ehrlichii]|uniref:MobA-like NTP transferase domain-containing protein n=1 Tax=Alkalilimnicola ehrlichii TaxID=351052 RepID=A0A3E0WUS7_9GAMM|nr:phosphocholine cytidylyltransferase family protein [Alkalilimnicola ehrlichii]RFA28553.1 hypothetical protein CAI21_11845 [Alkalilimnicola ehrlichii]RFA35717.1 hypothetical protein CAL65_12365 [Alkalilimnicola ehrlichii]
MQAILMAAGRGTRISKDINGVPKCTLDVCGQSLIRYTSELLLDNGVDVAVTVGFRSGQVVEQLRGLPVDVFFNPFYRVTNSIASLWFAKDFWQDDDVLLMNADVYIEQDTLDLIASERSSAMLLADCRRVEQGDFFLQYENGRLLKYGKQLPVEERTGEYVGLAKVAHPFKATFLDKLLEMISAERYNDWWENVLYELSDEGASIDVVEIGRRFWSEIDQMGDYRYILRWLNAKQKVTG